MKSPERKQLDEQVKKAVAERLKNEREKRFNSQGDAVAHIDYRLISDNSAWSRYETGVAEIPTALYKILHDDWGVDLNWLIAGDTTGTPSHIPVEVEKALKIVFNFFCASMRDKHHFC